MYLDKKMLNWVWLKLKKLTIKTVNFKIQALIHYRFISFIDEKKRCVKNIQVNVTLFIYLVLFSSLAKKFEFPA